MKTASTPTPIKTTPLELKRVQSVLAKRLQHRRAEALQARDYERYLQSLGWRERFQEFLNIEHLLPDDRFWKYLNFVWVRHEVSGPERQDWLRLFKSPRLHRELLMSSAERECLDAMPEIIRIYRGYLKGGGRSGMSWTPSRQLACLYATNASRERQRSVVGHRLGDTPMIVTARCFRRDVLAHFNDCNEQEIVIDPRDVFGMRSRRSDPNSAR